MDAQKLTLSVIAAMRREGVAATRTRLVKFLYLADLQYARFHGGQTLTGWCWYVGPFGPVAAEALALFDRGVSEGWLGLWAADATEPDEDQQAARAVIYNIGEQHSEEENELPVKLGKLRDWIRRYGDSTNRLLGFVYGNTEPMERARPGEVLDFSTAIPPGPGAAIKDRDIGRKDQKKLDELMRKLRAEHAQKLAANAAFADGPNDDEFRTGIPRDGNLPSGPFILSFAHDEE